MDRIKVSSSNIVSVGYDDDTSTLEVEFKSGSVYQLKKVPYDIYSDFLKSPSLGRFFNSRIRPKFQSEKVS